MIRSLRGATHLLQFNIDTDCIIRNFLLFLPTNAQAPLKAVLSYYSSTVSVNSEGDTSIREETLEGLGRPPISYLNVLFGAIINLAVRPQPQSSSADSQLPTPQSTSTKQEDDDTMFEANQALSLDGMYAHKNVSYVIFLNHFK
jgi:solute carrier family 25 phosphate transporter 23/24/25/41